jgi:flagellin-like hook-associated protein FlgL
MHIDTSSGGGKGTYTIYDSITGAQVAKRTTEVDFSAGAASVINDADDKLGFTIDDSTDTAISAGDDLYFEYIEKNHAKVVLYEIGEATDGSETATAVAVDADGSDATGVTDATTNYFYAEAGATYDTGRGIDVDMDAWANIVDYATDTDESTTRFDLLEAGAVSIALNSAAQANDFMSTVDDAITTVTNSLNSVGSLVARLDAKEEAVGVQQVNTEAAYNRIMNADMAYEQVEASKFQILQQTAVAMLAQANLAPQGILSLFR